MASSGSTAIVTASLPTSIVSEATATGNVGSLPGAVAGSKVARTSTVSP
ncbi:MAG: hypothetical protein JO248_01600 [Acidimicrobiia bacterium]|nr:hypothetical protein [Acidimicrobiia bacterium]